MPTDKRPGLTKRVLIDTALRLLDEVGLEGLTVRRLAAELGVRSPALYWHIRTKQELLDGMADAICRAPGMGPPRDDETWQDWLLRRARAYRAALLARRDGARVVAHARSLSHETVVLFERELAAMVERGFTPALALHTIAALTSYVNGFVLREQAAAAPESLDGAPAAPQSVDEAPAVLAAAVREGGGTIGGEAFEHGLRVFIAGTSAVLSQERDGPATASAAR
ncbi:TetR family transcriptional regulator [Nonomuraea fuscirosea]|uniref:TetR family transcriptional regulator n=1 Tax=Nonomuraea fuscirosea TaxID=1291556 RepID=A0A2T0MMR1_9ACTN|nr:TetR/AcrR family transcriptional regulator C-terminal domain-containing protein [Nonomuraea fuscirosea]PRX59120.1 TetR family transcriptional regulator [Nonomuraea fuscirosea]